MDLLSALDTPSSESAPQESLRLMCSARACHEHAHWTLLWNNPKLHAADRRKTWLACDAHRDSLSEFLQMRGFLRECRPAPSARVGG